MTGNKAGAQGTQLLSAVNLTGAMTGQKVVAVADFNGDGHPDVVFQNAAGAATVYFYTGAGGATPNGTSVLSTGNPWSIAGPH